MAIQSGSHVGPYEILSTIGAGGMGEVYRARDPKLGRDVAIKVLPEAFARNAERKARFQREAKVLASLDHPNIASIYGLEDSGGTCALVMQLVEGPTLADRIRAGPIPIDESIRIARQIADALEYAHERGIIHRDLKPSNVKVTNDDTVKVLDFGLAKVLESDLSSIDISTSPTITRAATQGVLLGTTSYMSPEQAKGKSGDRRSDLWAFGCVLYEMLTRKKAFPGETVTDTLAAVIRAEPEWSQLPSATPMRVRALLQRCLQKDPKQRLQAIGEARIALDEVLSGVAEPLTSASTARVSAGFWRQALPWMLFCLTAVALTALAIVHFGRKRLVLNSAHVQIVLPVGDQLDMGGLDVALSSDGTELAYVGIHEGVPQLYIRALDAPEPKAIAGTEGAFNPFFSPDGRWIGFFAQGKMKKVPVGGGPALTLCDAGSSGGASWGSDDTIIFAPSAQAGAVGLSRVSASGGEPRILTTPDLTKGEYSHRYPQILPGGKAVVFTAMDGFGWDESRIEVLRLDTGERRVLIRGGHTGRYLPAGDLIYYRAGALLEVPFDLARLEAKSNTPVVVADGVFQNAGAAAASYAVSDAGVLAYIPAPAGARQFEQRLIWIDRQGKIEALAAPTRAYAEAALSPDGQHVVVVINSGTQELWVYDLVRRSLTRLVSDQGSSQDAIWTPDGRRIAYRSNRAGHWELYWRSADGSGSEDPLTGIGYNDMPSSWSPDGKELTFTAISPKTGFDIWMLPLEGDRKPRPFLRTPFNESWAQFSPDGHWLAYESDESGSTQIYVQGYPGPGGKWQLSTEGGRSPAWNPSGRELFYRNGDKTMVVATTTSPSFSAGKPRLLYEGPEGNPTRDGQRFLGIQAAEPAQPPTQITLVLNWISLRRK